ncbi:hypothetical protein RRG08_058328 [Elysia crispata]|uniref:Uncharacterized protein n=1 Tax=Elysia crispata TaxID=231223 RepID=A0AAE0XEP6_9GAST|nr:hypothetical protein RRG08_058328 [Elysia crispata]
MQELLLMEELKQLAANVYEAFSQDPTATTNLATPTTTMLLLLLLILLLLLLLLLSLSLTTISTNIFTTRTVDQQQACGANKYARCGGAAEPVTTLKTFGLA